MSTDDFFSDLAAYFIAKRSRAESALVTVRSRAYGLVSLLIASLLAAAAAFKAYELFFDPASAATSRFPQWLQFLAVEYDFALSAFLLSGLWRRVAHSLALATFAGFAAIAGYLVLSGQPTCACFGNIRVHPGVTFTIDIVSLSLLLWIVPPAAVPSSCAHRSEHQLFRSRLPALVLSVLVGSASITLPLFAYVTSPPTRHLPGVLGNTTHDGALLVLEPEQWIGQPFPLFAYVDLGHLLHAEAWRVLFYHHDCPDCQRAIRRLFLEAAGADSSMRSSLRTMLVELPPYGPAHQTLTPFDTEVAYARLTDTRKWFVSTPFEIQLRDGTVEAVRARTTVSSVPAHEYVSRPTHD